MNIEELAKDYRKAGDKLVEISEIGPNGYTHIITVPGGGWVSPNQFIKDMFLPKCSEEFKTNLKKYILENYSSKDVETLMEIL